MLPWWSIIFSQITALKDKVNYPWSKVPWPLLSFPTRPLRYPYKGGRRNGSFPSLILSCFSTGQIRVLPVTTWSTPSGYNCGDIRTMYIVSNLNFSFDLARVVLEGFEWWPSISNLLTVSLYSFCLLTSEPFKSLWCFLQNILVTISFYS